ncbi:MAG: ATP-binding cassette domain-containing protein, partial [Streptosporangiales bacterium]|nr:ATP-binding cassette domain-containing protein [Streptosporangiales bacterium]
MTEPMIEVSGLVKHYRTRGRGEVRALDGVDFAVGRGEVLGLVGESGCGKSTTARLLVRLEEATAGTIRIGGREVTGVRGAGLAELRRTVQLVFQDPYASLNPRMRAGDALDEVLRVHRPRAGAAERRAAVGELFELVGLGPSTAGRFPHQLSGGQRQRVGIARALAVRPEVLVLDEPVSALDVSVRAEIINLLERLRAELSLTYVFISHDLGMVRHLADRIAVMYLGRIVEYGPWDAVSDRPLHPYARALQAAVPVADPALDARPESAAVAGEVPDAANVPTGCRFHPRCVLAEDVCRTTEPALLPPAGPAHSVACHVVARELAAGGLTADRPAA